MGKRCVIFYIFAEKYHNIWGFSVNGAVYKIWRGVDRLQIRLIVKMTWQKKKKTPLKTWKAE